VTEDFASEEKAAEVESYFASNEWPGTERGVQQAVESIRLNAAWLSRDSEAIKNFLKDAIA
jgi:puromycin-sensitive aminopeptidase